jgi:type II secretory pathway component PulF
MQKYKIVASKSQKKYTVILSADSETEAKEKLHKDGYSVLSISKLTSKDIDGQKFLFQVEKDGEIKNGVII